MTTLIGADQSATVANAGGGGATIIFWQTFTALYSGTVTALVINISSTHSATGMAAAMYDSTGTSLLGSTSSSVPANGLNTLSVTTPFTIVSGVQYKFVAYVGGSSYISPTAALDSKTATYQVDPVGWTFPTFGASLPAGTSGAYGTLGYQGTGTILVTPYILRTPRKTLNLDSTVYY